MRCVIVSDFGAVNGGAAKVAIESARGLAEAGGPIGQPELHDHRALAADGAERQLVRPDGGDVEDAGLDAFDEEGASHGGAVGLNHKAWAG